MFHIWYVFAGLIDCPDLRKRIFQMPISVPMERITSKIHLIRGQKMMLDSDLAALYDVDPFYRNRENNGEAFLD
jgi:hypothetical protein